MVADRARDEARGDRGAVIVQDRHQAYRIDAVFVDDQLTKLRIAVLFDHINKVVIGDEARDAGMEREGSDTKPVGADPDASPGKPPVSDDDMS